MQTHITVAAVTVSSLLTGSILAQETERERIQRALERYDGSTLVIPHIEGPVEIDGSLQDAVWQLATRTPIDWQDSPVGGIEARDPTTVYIMEDGETLYVGFKADDADPESIPAFLRDRDTIFQDDHVGIGIDTTGDGSRAFQFFANALGVQADAISDTQNWQDESFDAIFDTGGQITPEGFEVEFAIPLSQLRFPSREGMQQWRLYFTRVQYKDQRYQNVQYPVDRDNACFICQYQPSEGLEGARPGKQFQIVPTFTTKTVRSRVPQVARSGVTESDYQVGIDDFRWGITPNISLNATLNPDFSQLEADVAQLNVNTTQALFFPERRPFFLEGRDLFNTRLNLVNTRNISDPDYGVKLSGKADSNVFGLLTARDTTTNFLVADSQRSAIESLDLEHQVTLLRYRRDFGNLNHLGVLVTNRDGNDYHNRVVSVDGRYRINNQDAMALQLVQTRSKNPQALMSKYGMNRTTSGDGYRLAFSHNSSDWFAFAANESIADGFRADAGFINHADIERSTIEFGRNWRGQPGAFVSNVVLGMNANWVDQESSGDFLEKHRLAFASIDLPRNTQLNYDVGLSNRVYNGRRFELGSHSMFVRSNLTGGVFLFSRVRVGDQIDFANTRKGDIIEYTQELNYNISRNILMRLRHNYRNLQYRNEDLFTANLTDLRLTYRFNVRSSLQLTTIYSDLVTDPARYSATLDRHSNALDAQLLFRYQVNPQSEFFAGYSTSGINNDDLSTLEKTADTFFIKLSYAWQL